MKKCENLKKYVLRWYFKRNVSMVKFAVNLAAKISNLSVTRVVYSKEGAISLPPQKFSELYACDQNGIGIKEFCSCEKAVSAERCISRTRSYSKNVVDVGKFSSLDCLAQRTLIKIQYDTFLR